VLEGEVANEAWFAFVAQLDPATRVTPPASCSRPTPARVRRLAVEGPHWLKANPNLGVSLAWEYLREQVRVAIEMPSEQNIVKRLNFCIWTDQVTVWIPVDRWNLCRAAALALADFRARLARSAAASASSGRPVREDRPGVGAARVPAADRAPAVAAATRRTW
jgi:phage terminase large subunit-like protein